MDYGKRTLALLLTLVLLLTLPLAVPDTARAVIWGPPSPPHPNLYIDVDLYAAKEDGGGGASYYEVTPYAAARAEALWYSVRLELPSVADVNAYYGNAGFVEGSRIWVLLEYRGCNGPSERILHVPLASRAQELWYDGNGFTSTQGEPRILPLSRAAGAPKIRASVLAHSELKDLLIGGCYSVENKGFVLSGAQMWGMLFKGGCTDNDIFLATDESHRVNGLYVIDRSYKRDDLRYAELFQMLGPESVNCDTGESDYLNTMRHVFSLLGFGYADIKGGELYLSDGYFTSRYSSGGTLSDAVIGGCYGVSARTFENHIPCRDCAPTDLHGYLIEGSCGRYGAFFAIDEEGLCTDAFIVDGRSAHAGAGSSRVAMEPFSQTLYGWTPNDGGYSLAPLPAGAVINPSFASWQNSYSSAGFAAWCSGGTQPGVSAPDWTLLYYSDSPSARLEDGSGQLPFIPLHTKLYADEALHIPCEPAVSTSATAVYDANSSAYFAYNADSAYSYGHIYLYRSYTQDDPAYFHRLLSENEVENDSAEKSLLNSASYLLHLLGLDAGDVLNGNTPISQRWMLDKFGFSLYVRDAAPLDVGLRGDVNRDDTVSLADAVLLARHLVGSATLSAEQLLLADVDAGGEVNVADVTALCGALVGGFVIPPL